MAFDLRVQASIQHGTRDLSSFDRVRRAASEDHIFDLRHKTGRVGHVRCRRKEELRRDDLAVRELRREAIIPERAVEHEQGGAQAVVSLDEVGGGIFHQLGQLAVVREILRARIEFRIALKRIRA